MGKKKNFPSYEEAKKIVMENGIKTMEEYRVACKDLGLPSAPSQYYNGRGWTNRYDFFGNEKNEYPSYEEAKKIVQNHNIRNQREFLKHFKELGLPSNPQTTYKNKGWIDNYDFYGKEHPISFPTYEDAKKILRKKGIKCNSEYNKHYKELGLPSNPKTTYKDSWIDFYDFYEKERPIASLSLTYEEVKEIVKKNGIKSQIEYRKKYEELGLPSNPKMAYKDSWIDFYDFYEKERPIALPTYEKACMIVKMNGIRDKREYHMYRKKFGLPSSPEKCYKDKGWTNWYGFLGKSKPISSSARKTKVYTTLSISPVLLEDNAPLQIIYMLASQIDKKLASEIEELLNTASCEDRLNMVKEQLKSLKAEAESMSVSPSEGTIGELSAMESMMDVFEDTLGSLPEDTTEYLNSIIKNYYHNATNRALIAEYDD